MGKQKIDFGFTPSKYQEAIFDFVQHGTGNAVIRAMAGSGKSTTMATAMKLIPKKQKCLFIAFNKSIVEDLSEKLKNYPNCTVKTIHGLGYSIIQRNLEETPVLDEYKYRNFLKQNVCELSQLDCENTSRTVLEDYVDTITSLINFARYNLCQTPKEVKEIADKYGFPYYNDECEVTIKCLEWGKKNLSTIDYTDMVWLPYELSMSPKGNQYDWVMFDEAQDASKAYVDLFLRTFKRGTRFIAAGDEKQAINLFAGSSADAFEYLTCYPHTKLFTLPICYRCDRVIIELIQTLEPDIEARENAGGGNIFYDCHISKIKDGDMVLCRSKAPLAKLYAKLIKKGVNCHIKGSDIGTNLIELIKSTGAKKINPEMLEDGLFIRLYERMINERNNMMEKHGLDIWDATLSSPVLSLYDMIETLRIFSEGCSSVEEITTKIENTFKDESDGICLSTIHKAKGLEADNVYILCRSTMPPKRISKDWEILQENNLIYVAFTRAKHILGFVSEDEVRPSGSLDNDGTIVNDIAFIEKKVCRVLGIPLTEDKQSPSFAKFRLKAATKIEDKHKDDNVKYADITETKEDDISLDELLTTL